MTFPVLTRRNLLGGMALGAVAGLAGCATPEPKGPKLVSAPFPTMPVEPDLPPFEAMYAATEDGGFKLPAIPWTKIDQRYLRQIVPNVTGEAPETLVVDTNNHFLYFTRHDGQAVRYGVGLGREGFAWTGRGYIERKAQWPSWHPPDEMIDRQPELEKYRTTFDKKTGEWLGGMEGGPQNPLGARAHYIYQDGKDTLYRIHGSPEWKSIGKSVSSGCVRMMNQDVIDLFERVAINTPVIVTADLSPAV